MKLFHKTPQNGVLQTGVNITYVKKGIELLYRTEKVRTKAFLLYLVKEKFGFIAVYFIKVGKWRLSFRAVRYPNARIFIEPNAT